MQERYHEYILRKMKEDRHTAKATLKDEAIAWHWRLYIAAKNMSIK